MNIALRRPMTLADFLAWEERREQRYEFDGFQPVAMTGGTLDHETIGGTLRAFLHERLRGKLCRPWGPATKIEVMGRIRYPDAYVSCTPASGRGTIVPEPVVVFEVLSAGTSRTDRIEKVQEYQATPSIQRYVILEQGSIGATVFERRPSGDWAAFALTEGGSLHMPEIGVEVALAEIYADVTFPSGEDVLPDGD